MKSSESLFKDYPELSSLYNYTLGLKFDEKPQYAHFLSTFSKILEKHDEIDDKMFDWILLDDDEGLWDLNHKFDVYEGE
jgi:hypothetical protein